MDCPGRYRHSSPCLTRAGAGSSWNPVLSIFNRDYSCNPELNKIHSPLFLYKTLYDEQNKVLLYPLGIHAGLLYDLQHAER